MPTFKCKNFLMSHLRQLAAIAFADIEGYTAMVQADEARAKSIRDKFLEFTQRTIPLYNGRVVQYTGDGAVCLFNSAVDAVLAAIAVQQHMLHEPRVPLRIGIHSGDVIIEDNGIFGDGVNLASRIESFAAPGSVLVSDKVFHEI